MVESEVEQAAEVQRGDAVVEPLLVAFDRRGFAVRITDKNETFVTVMDEAFQIALVERLKQVTVKHTYGNRVDLEPSGRLMVRIGASYHNAGVSDSESRRVEEFLNRFVVNLVRRAHEAKRQRAVNAERQQRWAAQDEKNRLAQQQRDSELAEPAGTSGHVVIVPDPRCYSGNARPRIAKARGSPAKW